MAEIIGNVEPRRQPSELLARLLVVGSSPVAAESSMRGQGSGSGHGHPAFDRLYADTRLELLRLARLIVDDLQTAEDVTQDAYLGLYQNWHKLRDEDKAIAYVRSAVINNARSVLRRRAVTRLIFGRLSSPDERYPPGDDAATRADDERQIRVALRAVGQRQREALVLRYYLGLSYDEIAQTLNVSTGTVKASISRGLQRLERQLGETND